jgi:hypothetical protein
MREFRDVGAFLSYLRNATYRNEEAGAAGIERAARLVKAEAVREIGRYQDEDLGPFLPWAELADGTKDERVREGFSENEPGLRFPPADMPNSIGYVVGTREGVVGSDSQHLEWFELGTVKQRPRSVLGLAAFRTAKDAVDAMASAPVASLAGVSSRVLVAAHGGRESDGQ